MTQIIENIDAAGNTGTTYSFSPGDTFLGTITAFDDDWIRASLEAGYGYYARMAGDGGAGSLTNMRLDLLDSGGGQITGGSGGASSLVAHSPSQDETVFFEATGQFTSSAGGYRIDLYQEIANTLATNAGIAVGGTATSVIDYGNDRDLFETFLDVGSGYIIEMKGDGGNASIPDSDLTLLDSGGAPIKDGSGGSTAVLTYTPTASQTFYIQAEGRFSSDVGGYELSVTEEIANSLATTATLAGGASVTSAIDYGQDQDYFRVELTAGSGYYFEMRGAGGAMSIEDSFLNLFDAGGAPIAESNGGAVAILPYSPAEDATVYISAEGYFAGSLGDYELSLFEEVADTLATAASLMVGDVETSALDYGGDADLFRVELEAGVTYSFDIMGDGGPSSLTDGRFVLLDSGGANIGGGPTSQREFTPVTDGSFYVRVEGASSASTGGYALSVESLGTGPTPGPDKLIGTEESDNIDGLAGDDTISGLTGDDSLLGNDDDDIIAGAAGNDTVDGGAGDDNMGGGLGDDMITGGIGNDTIGAGKGHDNASGGIGDDGVFGGAGNDTLNGGEGDDTMGAGFDSDVVNGNGGNDLMGGGTGKDTVDGGAGNDALGGGEGDDTMIGGSGNDTVNGGGRHDLLDGGIGDDQVNGGAGNDTATGGAGSDLFVFNEFTAGAVDIITDWTDGEDMFRMTGIQNAPGSGLAGKVAALNATQVGADVEMSYGGNTIVLQNAIAGDIGVEDFLFL